MGKFQGKEKGKGMDFIDGNDEGNSKKGMG